MRKIVLLQHQGSGYLDCKYFVTARQFLNWETRLFNAGLITRLHQGAACKASPNIETISYMNVEKAAGKPRLIAYFDRKENAESFMRERALSGRPRAISANEEERYVKRR